MEPVNNSDNVEHHRSYLQQGERCCMYTPFLCCATLTVGGTGFAFATAFGSGTLTNVAMGQIAYNAFAALSGVFGGAGYWYIMPEKIFEEAIQDQKNATDVFKNTIGDLDKSLDTFQQQNVERKKLSDETEVNFKDLIKEFEQKKLELLQLSDQYRTALNKEHEANNKIIEAEKMIQDAKEIAVSIIQGSNQVKKEFKTSNIVLGLLKDSNEKVENNIKKINLEVAKLPDVLIELSKTVGEEHEQVAFLIKAAEELAITCQMLKKELDEFTKDGDDFADDVTRDIHNTSKLEALEKELAEITKKL